MASHQKVLQSSVTADRLFAPAPHGLINDPTISHAAFRLWCVLHRLAWLREPPEIARMAEEMRQDDRTPDRRSVYRWLCELESSGWLDWERTPGKVNINRFVVRSERKPVTPESQPVTLRSQPVTPESQPVIVESQAPPIHARPERAKNGSQNHENHEIGGGGDRARESNGNGAPEIADLIALFARYDITQAEPLARLYRDKWPDVTVEQLTRLCERLSEPDAGSYAGARLYRKLKAGPYERPERQRNDAPHQRGRSADPLAPRGKHAPTGGAELRDPGWMDRELAKFEALARESEL